MYRTQMKVEIIDDASQFHYPCYVSEKLDGWRCLITDGVMYTSGGKEFKPPVQERFKPIIEAAHRAKLVLDGELFYNHNSNFGELSSTLSASLDVMAERNLRFYAFDAITYDEWHGRAGQETFEQRKARYEAFGKNIDTKLYVAVEQCWCASEADADAYYGRVKSSNGEGVMMRVPYGKYQPNTRSKRFTKFSDAVTLSMTSGCMRNTRYFMMPCRITSSNSTYACYKKNVNSVQKMRA